MVNSLALRYFGVDILGTEYLYYHVGWVIFSFLFPVVALEYKDNSDYIRHCLFSVVMTTLWWLWILLEGLKGLSDALRLAFIPYLLLDSYHFSDLVSYVVIIFAFCLAVKFILFSKLSYLEVLIFTLLIAGFHVFQRLAIHEVALLKNYGQYSILQCSLACALAIFIHSKRYGKAKSFSFGLILFSLILSFLILMAWHTYDSENNVSANRKIDSSATIEIGLSSLDRMTNEPDIEKFKLYLASSPMWLLNKRGKDAYVARLRSDEDVISIPPEVKNKYIHSYSTWEGEFSVDIYIESGKDKIGGLRKYEGETFQKVSANSSQVELQIFKSERSYNDSTEIKIEIQSPKIALFIVEKSKGNTGEKAREFLNLFRAVIEEIDEMQSVNVPYFEEMPQCFFDLKEEEQALERGASRIADLKVWGFLNTREQGTALITVNDEEQKSGYADEVIGWSDESKYNFYFHGERRIKLNKKDTYDVEIRFYPDSKNKRWADRNYQVAAKCEQLDFDKHQVIGESVEE